VTPAAFEAAARALPGASLTVHWGDNPYLAAAHAPVVEKLPKKPRTI
jgi:hypothetical protein